MHFKIETISALPTDISYRKLRLRPDRKSGVPVRQPPASCATPFTGLSWHGSLTRLSPCCSISAHTERTKAQHLYLVLLMVFSEMPMTDWSQCLLCARPQCGIWHAGPSHIVTEAWDHFGHFWHCTSLVCILLRGPWTVCDGWQCLVLSQPPSVGGSTGFGPWANPVHIVLPAPLWLDMSLWVWLSKIRWYQRGLLPINFQSLLCDIQTDLH